MFSTHLLLVGNSDSLLLGIGTSPDVTIDMDSVQRDQSQMSLLHEQVWALKRLLLFASISYSIC